MNVGQIKTTNDSHLIFTSQSLWQTEILEVCASYPCPSDIKTTHKSLAYSLASFILFSLICIFFYTHFISFDVWFRALVHLKGLFKVRWHLPNTPYGISQYFYMAIIFQNALVSSIFFSGDLFIVMFKYWRRTTEVIRISLMCFPY